MLLFHAELGDRTEHHEHLDPRHYSTFLDSSPPKMEMDAISMVAELSAQYPTLRTHIVHLSASSALPLLREARRTRRLPMTVETCFHYLCLESERVPDGRTDFKCCPPIRDHSNRERLWQALLEGDIDFVVSDHSPCVVELKKMPQGDFLTAWGGIGGLGLGLSLVHTETRLRNISICRLVEWLASKPAQMVGIQDTKGHLKVGADADFVVFDASRTFTVSLDLLDASTHSRPRARARGHPASRSTPRGQCQGSPDLTLLPRSLVSIHLFPTNRSRRTT